jgi:hypothetical protein
MRGKAKQRLLSLSSIVFRVPTASARLLRCMSPAGSIDSSTVFFKCSIGRMRTQRLSREFQNDLAAIWSLARLDESQPGNHEPCAGRGAASPGRAAHRRWDVVAGDRQSRRHMTRPLAAPLTRAQAAKARASLVNWDDFACLADWIIQLDAIAYRHSR